MPRKLRPVIAEAAPAAPTTPQSSSGAVMIETARLLRPKIPARETFDEETMGELVQSIASVGIILPLVVRREGELYRVIDGDRRRAAAIALELPECPCVVRQPEAIRDFALTIGANQGREDMNPAEEARYYMRLLEEEFSGDIEQLSVGVRKSIDYINSRLVLLRGDPLVLQALAEGSIPMAVANELNKVTTPANRLVLLDVCIKQGASARMAREWRIQDNQMMAGAPAVLPAQEPAGVAALPAPVTTMSCLFCGDSDETWDMEIIYVHRRCRKLQDRLAAASQPAAG
jgi:ParB/RepB/Spo0J family partition protein